MNQFAWIWNVMFRFQACERKPDVIHMFEDRKCTLVAWC
jgi:hypothetical protein